MRKSKFTEDQIIGFLKQAEAGLAVAQICRKGGFPDATFYKWRATRRQRMMSTPPGPKKSPAKLSPALATELIALTPVQREQAMAMAAQLLAKKAHRKR